MKIGKETVPRTAISTANSSTIVVRGRDLAKELIGKVSFADYFFMLVSGELPSPAASAVLNASLVAIAEHGLVPSVQASRMTLAAAPDALQGAVAAGVLGCGSVVLGASESSGRFLADIRERALACGDLRAAVRSALVEFRETRGAVPGFGHPLHKARDPRVAALFRVAEEAGANLEYVRIAEAVEEEVPDVLGRSLAMNVSAALPAVLLGVGFPLDALKGVPILARVASLIGHLTEELSRPIGFALAYQATRQLIFDGDVPAGFSPDGELA
jgi:citrate synthase